MEDEEIKSAFTTLKDRLDLTSDGCSNAPDFNFTKCCKEHDYYYRNPVELTGVSRAEADRRLRRCIRSHWGGPVMPWIYWGAVRLFGWIPWNKAGKAAREGDTSRLHPPKPRHLRRGAAYNFTNKKVTFDEY